MIISSFASHVHRIQQCSTPPTRTDARSSFVGRSMVRNMGVAQDLGYLKVPKDLIVPLDQLEKKRRVRCRCKYGRACPHGRH